jgi:hypothetical protein
VLLQKALTSMCNCNIRQLHSDSVLTATRSHRSYVSIISPSHNASLIRCCYIEGHRLEAWEVSLTLADKTTTPLCTIEIRSVYSPLIESASRSSCQRNDIAVQYISSPGIVANFHYIVHLLFTQTPRPPSVGHKLIGPIDVLRSVDA